MSLEYSVTGLDVAEATLRRVGSAVRQETIAGLYQVAEEEMAEAKRRVPVDTGALAGSGYVSPPQVSGSDVSVALGFGGPAAPYALHVHENLEALHPTGQAKYLESTLVESAPYMAERIARRVAANRLG